VGRGPDLERFLTTRLLEPIGITDARLGFDAAGAWVGSSYLYMPARQFAKFGLLYLRDGAWDGRRVLPEGWVDFSRSVAKAENNGVYGGHFWVNGTPIGDQFQPLRPGLEAFEMSGAAGQFVVIVPDRDLVLVRLGEMQRTSWDELSVQLSDVVTAFPVTR
jgi:CubicO group peptidase (beta-lactamase class C family)